MTNPVEDKLQELLGFAKKHGLQEIEWRENGTKISFRRSPEAPKRPAPAPVAAADTNGTPEVPSNECVITSPMVGTFRRAGSKNGPPLVLAGNHIKPGDRVGVVECMKIPNDVLSFCAGEVKQILVEDGRPVEYGQPLFILETAENGTSEN